MKLSTFAIIVTILSLLFGLQFLFIPAKIAEFYGAKIDDTGILLARSLGACFCLLGLIYWSYRDMPVTTPTWSKLLLLSLIFDLVQLVIGLMTVLNGTVNAMGWITVAIYLFYAVASVYYLSQSKKPETAIA